MNAIQRKELDILKEVIKVFDKYDLKYYAIGGTCIGAVRHHGFIPWDDDIDIAMPRKDYEEFRYIYYKELPVYLKKMDGDCSRTYANLFMKIHDTTTAFIEKSIIDYPDRYTGAFIDIMPIDGFPNSKICSYLHCQKLRLLQRLNVFNRPHHHKERGKIFSLLLKWKDIVWGKIFSYNFFSELYDKVASKYDFCESKRIFFSWQIEYQEKRKVFDYYDFKSCQSIQFEDTVIHVPINYDAYLRQDFGNYMELPSKEERNSGHNVYISDMEKSYTYYIDKVGKNK